MNAISKPVTPFSRDLPFDVTLGVISSLDVQSLHALSLASKDFNHEVNRILWRTIRITSLSHFQIRFNAILQSARLASYIRGLEVDPTDIFLHTASTCREFSFGLGKILSILPNLNHLTLRIPNNWHNITSNIFASHGSYGSTFKLRSFTLHGAIAPSDPDLERFLAKHSTIERLSLKLTYYPHAVIVPTLYPLSVLPNLKSIQASPEMILHLAPGRPLRSADATCRVIRPPILANFIESLSQSGDDIKSLALDFQDYTEITPVIPSLVKLAQTFPQIRSLKILYTLFDDVDVELPGVLGMFPALEDFTCQCMVQKFGYFDCLPENEGDVEELTEYSETLKKVVYTSAYGQRGWERSEVGRSWVKFVDTTDTGYRAASALKSARFSRE